MLDKFPTLFRLFLCLFLSAGLHGGLVYLGWVEKPAKPRPQAPVELTFLPIVDVSPLAADKLLKEPQKPVVPPDVQSQKKQQTEEKHRPAVKQEKLKSIVSPEAEPEAVLPEEDLACIPRQEISCAQTPGPQDREQVVRFDDKTSEANETVAPKLEDEVPEGKFEASLIEAVPRYSSNPLPEYPYLARQRRWEGVVWLLVDVSSEGFVKDLNIEKTSGYRILDKSAIRAVRRWRFVPATRAGLPVASKARIPVRFHLEEG